MRSRQATGRHPIHRDVINPALLDQATAAAATVTPLGLGGALVEMDTQQPDASATAITAVAEAFSQ